MALCRVDRRGAQPIAGLGRADRARDVVAALLADRGLRPSFPQRLEAEAAAAAERLAADPGDRRDLVAEPTFTVDPASARDFDDAVSARPEGDGFRIWVHIADVAAHIEPGSGLDREARERANSTYVPGMVAPMLPPVLSDGACSLSPGVERLTLTAEIAISAIGEPTSAAFYRSRIRSDARLDYDGLDRIFSGAERAPEPVADGARHGALGGRCARRAGRVLRARRLRSRAAVRVRSGGRRRGRPRGRADRGPSVDRAPDGAHQRAGRDAARAQGRADPLPGP